MSAGTFYKTLRKLSGLDLANSSDYKLLDRSVVESIRDFKESSLFFRGIVDFVGFDRCEVPIEIDERKAGKSKFRFSSHIKLALNAITSFSSSLLYITFGVGVIFFLCAVILGVQTVYNKLIGVAESGFTTVILLELIIGSCVMFSLAIIGLYVGKIYNEVKRRPQYIVSEVTKEN